MLFLLKKFREHSNDLLDDSMFFEDGLDFDMNIDMQIEDIDSIPAVDALSQETSENVIFFLKKKLC